MVLYDLSALSNAHKTGIPNYLLQLARKLFEGGTPLAGFFDNGKILPPEPTRSFVQARLRSDVGPSAAPATLPARIAGRLRRELSLRTRPLAEALHDRRGRAYIRAHGIRLQHFTGHTIRHPYELPTLSTICDLTPYSHPELHAAHNVRAFRDAIEWLGRRIQKGEPTLLPVISHFTRAEIGRHLGAEFESRCRVTHLGYDPELFFARTESRRESAEFILSVGTLEPRKNLRLLLRAFEEFGSRHARTELLLVGAKGWGNERFEDAIARHPHRDRIRALGFVPDAELARLYRECALFCYPSLLEGFGLPPLEAMACGAPVVCSGTSSLPEVGGDAALYCDPQDTTSLVRALERGFDERAARRALSLAQAAKFSWEKCAADTQAAYREILGN